MDECKPLNSGHQLALISKSRADHGDKMSRQEMRDVQDRDKVGRCRLTLSNPC